MAEERVEGGFYGYGEDEVAPLAEAIRAHRLDVQTAPILAGGGGGIAEVPVIVSIGLGLGLGKMCELFFEQAYNAWLREPLARVLFREKEDVKQIPTLQLKGSDIEAYIQADSVVDLDEAVPLLPQVLHAFGEFEKGTVWQRERPLSPSLQFRKGAWRVGMTRRVFVYRPDTQQFEKLPRDQG